MKFGFRKPSINKRIAARTSVKRVVRHNLGLKAPRGWGWLTNPKKAAYNRVYSRTTKGCMVLILPVIAAAIGALILAGCEAECNNCSPNGSCVAGVCLCDRGFEGVDCGHLIRDRYTGPHQVFDTCNGIAFDYMMAVGPDSALPYTIVLGNLGNNVLGFKAEIDSTSVLIPAQTLQSQMGNVSATGHGMLTPTGFRLNYLVSDGFRTDTCHCTTVRQ